MVDIPVFFIKPSGRGVRSLRRFSSTPTRPCANEREYGYCNATVLHDYVDRDSGDFVSRSLRPEAARQFSTGWPAACTRCGTPFDDGDEWQIFCEAEYEDDRGAKYSLRDLPVGACYDATWYGERRGGEDGRHLYVQTPGGLWGIDERASNCTMREDDVHRCWVRHGRPEDGTLHVDKQGNTCAAGAGSILCGSYHGFLHGGKLTECPEGCRTRS